MHDNGANIYDDFRMVLKIIICDCHCNNNFIYRCTIIFFTFYRSFISCSREPLAGFGSNVDVSTSGGERGRAREKKAGSAKGRCMSLDTRVISFIK